MLYNESASPNFYPAPGKISYLSANIYLISTPGMEHKEETRIPTLAGAAPEIISDCERLWQAALGDIEIQVSRPNFVTWFKSSKLIEKNDSTAFITLPNAFAKEWIENKYAKIVLGAIRAIDETIKKVEFLVGDQKVPQPKTGSARLVPSEINQPSFPEFKIDSETNLNPRYTFGSFIVGKSNELAFAAANAIVDAVGSKYNPLFIYGGVGLGKTHLIQAVGNEIKTKYQNKIRVKYVQSEKFTNDVIQAIRNQRAETIKEKYRTVDVFIIDDIQFIIGKAATEEEFFHTFNALYQMNKQIIISSDKPPKFIPNLAERLLSRFEGGMIADISNPDYELRWAILKEKAREMAVELADDVIGLIAEKIQKNFRELEGVLNRVAFLQKTKNIAITLKTVSEILNDLIQEPTQNLTPNDIIVAVAESFEVSQTEICGQSRKKEVVEPRQIAMFLLREMLNLSYPSIGTRLGKRDHTTAIYAYEKIAKELIKNQSLNQKILGIKELITKK